MTGCLLGCLVAWWFSRWLSGLTYEVSAADESTWVLVAVVIGLTVVTASWRPAARASRVDPATLLGEE
jgi:ABC-type lipoprotein release transport system permease subunit